MTSWKSTQLSMTMEHGAICGHGGTGPQSGSQYTVLAPGASSGRAAATSCCDKVHTCPAGVTTRNCQMDSTPSFPSRHCLSLEMHQESQA